MEPGPLVEPTTTCFHCGEPVENGAAIVRDGKSFCCAGCKVVYEILAEHRLCDYYSFQQSPGKSPNPPDSRRFFYLDDPDLVRRLRDFSDGNISAATFRIPQMHCSSCIWLLERLHTIDPGILHSRADFLRKQLRVRYAERTTSLRRVAELLASLGYEPQMLPDQTQTRNEPDARRTLYYRVGIAGFCFSNIMLLSFPEYLGQGDIDPSLQTPLRFLNLALALPVFLYSASGFFTSALRGLKKYVNNLDVPIALGILFFFLQSVYDIASGSGPGYLDSMTGLVFFLLIGKVFQSKAYERLDFERDYRSYFPIAVSVRRGSGEIPLPLASVAVGDRIVVRNNELIPADSVLMDGDGAIDYSFVTGESRIIPVVNGTVLYAGGRQTGGAIELEVVKDVSQSYLTRLWSDIPTPEGREGRLTLVANVVSRYFTAGVLVLAGAAAVLWLPADPSRALHAAIAVLIVACPCALALAPPFAFGTAHRVLGRVGFYLKNTSVVEAMAGVDAVVFDKTGTITRARGPATTFVGTPLTPDEKVLAASVARNSFHPLSRAFLRTFARVPVERVENFVEIPGRGIQGRVRGTLVKIGARPYVTEGPDGIPAKDETEGSRVHLSIDGAYRGCVVVGGSYREGMPGLMQRMRRRYRLALVSGDREGERAALCGHLGSSVTMSLGQSPSDKLDFVRTCQERGERVMMVGDGLNDAGALRESRVGVAVTEDVASFSPACDAILEGDQLSRLDLFLRCARFSMTVVKAAFVLALLYNGVGLWFAFHGTLSPLVAAILMPLSSISIVAFSTGAVRFWARARGIR